MNFNFNQGEKRSTTEILYIVWSVIRPFLLVLTCVLIIIAAFYKGADFVLNKYLLPVDSNDHTPVQVVIKRNTSVKNITQILEDYNLVKDATVFKYYIDFSGYGNKLKAGTYVFNKQMGMEEIMDKMVKGDGRSIVTTFTIIEGSTVEDMANTLVKNNIISSKDRFLKLAKDGKEFMTYPFIAQLDNELAPNRKYLLEGYMFPAKYEIYVGSSEEKIIKRMLDKYNAVMGEKYLNRAAEIGLSVDQVTALASIVEKEAKVDDFKKVAAVFMNRLEDGTPLESCVTVQYITGKKSLIVTDQETSIDSPYNTYKYKGIPLGPICAPSQKAIEAVLYPDEEFIKAGYLFFTTKDPTSGELEFNIKYKDHQKAVEKYKPLWKDYENSKANNG